MLFSLDFRLLKPLCRWRAEVSRESPVPFWRVHVTASEVRTTRTSLECVSKRGFAVRSARRAESNLSIAATMMRMSIQKVLAIEPVESLPSLFLILANAVPSSVRPWWPAVLTRYCTASPRKELCSVPGSPQGSKSLQCIHRQASRDTASSACGGER